MRVGLICEGPIDLALLHALIRRIAQSRVGIKWPLQSSDIVEELRIRKGGYGQIPKALKRLIPLLDSESYRRFSLICVVLDEKRTTRTRREIRKLIGGKARFVLGIAIREIEAWWLADRERTLEWLGLKDAPQPGCRYWGGGYNSERDDDPKRTLNELTELSPQCDRAYGQGNTDLAREFANTWQNNANLRQISGHCRLGFAPFCKKTINALRRAQRSR